MNPWVQQRGWGPVCYLVKTMTEDVCLWWQGQMFKSVCLMFVFTGLIVMPLALYQDNAEGHNLVWAKAGQNLLDSLRNDIFSKISIWKVNCVFIRSLTCCTELIRWMFRVWTSDSWSVLLSVQSHCPGLCFPALPPFNSPMRWGPGLPLRWAPLCRALSAANLKCCVMLLLLPVIQYSSSCALSSSGVVNTVD